MYVCVCLSTRHERKQCIYHLIEKLFPSKEHLNISPSELTSFILTRSFDDYGGIFGKASRAFGKSRLYSKFSVYRFDDSVNYRDAFSHKKL